MINVKIPFDFYHDGVTKTHYPAGLQDVPEDAAKVALTEKWAVKVKKSDDKNKSNLGKDDNDDLAKDGTGSGTDQSDRSED